MVHNTYAYKKGVVKIKILRNNFKNDRGFKGLRKFILKHTSVKPHVRCMRYKDFWLKMILDYIAKKNNGLSKNFRIVDSYVLSHVICGEKFEASNAQIQNGIESGTHRISLHTVERVTSNLCGILLRNKKPLIQKNRIGKYGRHVEWKLDTSLIMKCNPNSKILVISYRIDKKILKFINLKHILALRKDKEHQLTVQYKNRMNHMLRKDDSIKWTMKQEGMSK